MIWKYVNEQKNRGATAYEANIQLTNIPALDDSRHTFQALLSTGDFGLISKPALAREIQTYYSAMDEANNLESAVHDHASGVHASRHRLGVSATGRVTIEQLGALAVSDPQLTAELETYWTSSAFQVRWMQGVRERTRRLSTIILRKQNDPAPRYREGRLEDLTLHLRTHSP